MKQTKYILIKLTVHNHAGVMSHITGLFSRRGYNLEGIICGKIPDNANSRMYLLVENNDMIEQILRQLRKLYDVVDLSVEENENNPHFKYMVQID